jgi:hypothetical protein
VVKLSWRKFSHNFWHELSSVEIRGQVCVDTVSILSPIHLIHPMIHSMKIAHHLGFCALLLHPIFSYAMIDVVLDRDQIQIAGTPPKAEFSVRVIDPPTPIQKLDATIGDKSVPVTITPTDADDGGTAVYFLLDVSDSVQTTRKRQIAAGSDVIKATANALVFKKWTVGVGTIGSNLRHFAWWDGKSSEASRTAALSGIPGNDQSSEIWRCTYEGLELLKGEPKDAKRKVLVLMSDGIESPSTDVKYNPDGVIRYAKELGIAVYAIGYAESEPQQSKWASMRRVAKETFASFIETEAVSHKAKGDFPALVQAMFKGTANVSLDLKDIPVGKQKLALRFDMANNQYDTLDKEIDVPVAAPIPEPETDEQKKKREEEEKEKERKKKEAESGNAVAGGSTSESAPKPPSITQQPWFWPAVAGGGLVLLSLLTWLIVRLSRKPKQDEVPPVFEWPQAPENSWGPNEPISDVSTELVPPPMNEVVEVPDDVTKIMFGWLQEMDKEGNPGPRHAISRNTLGIGRHKDNDIRIINDSVSAHHASIHRRRDGTPEITDLNSANGVYVNTKRVAHCVLKDDDLIEIGEVRLRIILNKSGI